jgi:uracil-DNA glycosylase
MQVEHLFRLYKQELLNNSGIETIFYDSGLKNEYAILDFGFFPLGSGILKPGKSKTKEAEINNCKIMVLGNDFGTVEYVEGNCPGKCEKLTNPTIRNLLQGLELDVEATFFTNLFLGLRMAGSNTKRSTPIKEDYKRFCFNFFKQQLDFFNPEIVLCLGKDVGKTLSSFPEFSAFKKSISQLFKDDTTKGFTVYTDNDFFGKRKFVLIPHPSFAYINWNKDDTRNKIKNAIAI